MANVKLTVTLIPTTHGGIRFAPAVYVENVELASKLCAHRHMSVSAALKCGKPKARHYFGTFEVDTYARERA